MSNDFATIENARPRFFQALTRADAIQRYAGQNDEYTQELQEATAILDDLRAAYIADMRRMERLLERVTSGVPLYDETTD